MNAIPKTTATPQAEPYTPVVTASFGRDLSLLMIKLSDLEKNNALIAQDAIKANREELNKCIKMLSASEAAMKKSKDGVEYVCIPYGFGLGRAGEWMPMKEADAYVGPYCAIPFYGLALGIAFANECKQTKRAIEIPPEIQQYVNENGMNMSTVFTSNGKAMADEGHMAIISRQIAAKQEALNTKSQSLMTVMQDTMARYQSCLNMSSKASDESSKSWKSTVEESQN